MTTATPSPTRADRVAPRLQICALWIATLFVFVHVDLFSLSRPDVRARLDEGKVHTFDVGEGFRLFTTLYVVGSVVEGMLLLGIVVIARTLVSPRADSPDRVGTIEPRST